jgi:alkanesulfonate monooxygenase
VALVSAEIPKDSTAGLQAMAPVQLFSICPSSAATPDRYMDRITQVAQWSEKAGCTGILVWSDNSLVDPWLVSQILIENTRSLCPLVAVQPIYHHPYAVAKMISTLGFLHGRRVFLNMVAGGVKNDLATLNDTAPYDARYQRLVEYTQIIRQVLKARSPVSFEGQFYRVTNLIVNPRLAPQLQPGVLMSGSSEAGMAAARAAGAVAIVYPEPTSRKEAALPAGSGPCGIRIGIIARPGDDDAWKVAFTRFPTDRKGQKPRQLAIEASDSAWQHRLAESSAGGVRQTYWLHPFENYQTNCPYLVGSYADIAAELGRYIELGYRTFILDIPASEEEFEHAGVVFEAVLKSRSTQCA